MKSLLKTVPFLLFLLVLGSCTLGGSVDQELQYQNVITNGGFENARALWTASGPGGATFALESTAANVSKGKYSGAYTASAASQFLLNDGVDVPDGLKGRDCLVTAVYKTAEAVNLYDLVIHDAVSTVLASASLATSASGFTKASANVTCPSSGKITVGLRSTGSAAVIYVDEFYLGENYLASIIAGDGLVSSGANTIAANPDNVTIEISSDQIKVKEVGTSEIADGSVTDPKLASKSVYCSAITGSVFTSSATYVPLATTSSITASGNRPIAVWIQSGTTERELYCLNSSNGATFCDLKFVRTSTATSFNATKIGGETVQNAGTQQHNDGTSLFATDNPGAGSTTYQLQGKVNGLTQLHYSFLQICAMEI